jgi:hypothetical protein
MRQDNEYMLAYLVRPERVGEEFLNWPLHMTVVPWFLVPGDIQEFIDRLRVSLEKIPAFSIQPGQETLFGHYLVSLIESDDMIALHQKLLEILASLGINFTARDRYIGENYRPHISHQKTETPSGSYSLSQLYLIAADKAQNRGARAKTIVTVLKLGEVA